MAYLMFVKSVTSVHDNVNVMLLQAPTHQVDLAISSMRKKGFEFLRRFAEKEYGLQFQKEYLLDQAKKYAAILTPELAFITKRNFLVSIGGSGYWLLYAKDYIRLLPVLSPVLPSAEDVAEITHANRIMFTAEPERFAKLKRLTDLVGLRVLKTKPGLPHTPEVDTAIADYLTVWDIICDIAADLPRIYQKDEQIKMLLHMFGENALLTPHKHLQASIIAHYETHPREDSFPIPTFSVNGIEISADDIII